MSPLCSLLSWGSPQVCLRSRRQDGDEVPQKGFKRGNTCNLNNTDPDETTKVKGYQTSDLLLGVQLAVCWKVHYDVLALNCLFFVCLLSHQYACV